jgi:hypothetical protein
MLCIGGPSHTSAYVSIRQRTSAYVSIRQHTSAYVSLRQHTSAYASVRQRTSAYVSVRQRTSAYVSVRQHTSAYVIRSIPLRPSQDSVLGVHRTQNTSGTIRHLNPASVSVATDPRSALKSAAYCLHHIARRMRAHRLAGAPAYVSIRQRTPAYISIRQHTSAEHTPAYVSIRQHTTADASRRQHTCAARAPRVRCSIYNNHTKIAEVTQVKQ